MSSSSLTRQLADGLTASPPLMLVLSREVQMRSVWVLRLEWSLPELKTRGRTPPNHGQTRKVILPDIAVPLFRNLLLIYLVPYMRYRLGVSCWSWNGCSFLIFFCYYLFKDPWSLLVFFFTASKRMHFPLTSLRLPEIVWTRCTVYVPQLLPILTHKLSWRCDVCGAADCAAVRIYHTIRGSITLYLPDTDAKHYQVIWSNIPLC